MKGLKSVGAETAQAIADYSIGPVVLDCLATLSAETAKDLAAVESWDDRLLSVTAFNAPDCVAVAHALATHQGPLALPNLKKISPKALSTLIAEEDVEIPLIETLELIRKPDGSETDDVVIPEAFEERQRQQKRISADG